MKNSFSYFSKFLLPLCAAACLVSGANLSADCGRSSSSSSRVRPTPAEEACAPMVNRMIRQAPYRILARTLRQSNLAEFQRLLEAVSDQATYELLLNKAINVALSTPTNTGRILIALPDGTVVVDTSRPNDPLNELAVGNSYQHFQDKTVNENHNSRIAILDAQLYPCGRGVESKLSSTTETTQAYVAYRLGNYLNNAGTVRISQETSVATN